MSKEKPARDRRKYDLARHHAWGGLGLLSVVSALRFLCPSIPDWVIVPAIPLLVAYVLAGLFLTYRYRASLREEPASGRADSDSEKAGLKLDKKRAKAGVKARKKAAG